ncbi:MAG: glycoside hydrolase family protein [Hyphomicrobiales bacterium]|nr:glycoside hydrolase family protein [Hyphomicrobiales bacterium]
MDQDTTGRIGALIARMTLQEKLGQLTMLADGLVETGPPGPHNPFNMVADGRVGSLLNVWGADLIREAQRRAVEESRLGVPLFFGLDVVHGHRSIHPVPLGEACAFDRALWEETARASAQEAAHDGVHMTFAPMIDVARDIRWGRIVECAGEDPYVNAQYARARVRGYQAPDETGRMRLAACAKHFCAYGAVLAGREYAEVDVSQRALEEVYLPPFRAAVDAGVAAIMPAFVDVAGVAMTAHRRLLREVLRAQWRFNGLIVTDYNSIAELVNHGVAADMAEAAALALNAGVDIDMMSDAYANGLPVALERGLVSMEDIDGAVRRVLALKQSLGLFDDPYRGMGPAGTPKQPPSAEGRRLSREAARRSIVLTQNRESMLPLGAVRTLAVVGPLADACEDQLGAWASAGAGEDSTTIIAGLRATWPSAEVRHALGAVYEGEDADLLAQAVEAARGADAVVLCVGESRAMNGEANTRTRPYVPQGQLALARAMLDSGAPVILVLCSGRPLILPDWLVEGARAVLIAWHAGTETGSALGDILSGACNPSARLAVTWPRVLGQVPIFFGIRPTGRPHDPANGWSTGFGDAPFAPRWSFGEGQGYARFARSNLRVDNARLGPESLVRVSVDVTNLGDRQACETVFVFSHDPVARVTRPLLELRDFTKVSLEPGETRTATFVLRAWDFAYPDETLKLRLDTGLIQLHVGASARACDLDRVDVEIVEGTP